MLRFFEAFSISENIRVPSPAAQFFRAHVFCVSYDMYILE